MEKSVAGLMLVKRHSKRLPNKNILPINGEPMFVVNLKKCLEIFTKVYVSTDDYEIYREAEKLGAHAILRDDELCGDTPNIPVYQHAMEYMDCDAFVAVQANSPTIDKSVITSCYAELLLGALEVITVHEDGGIYGSCWGMTRDRLENYEDPYNPQPDVLILDTSVDIHSERDYNLAISQLSHG